MSVARFISRVQDAIGPVLSSAGDVASRLVNERVSLRMPDDIEKYPAHVAGVLLTVNIAARLYPSIRLSGPQRVVDQCSSLALQINPLCDIVTFTGDDHDRVTVSWGVPKCRESDIAVSAVGWDVAVDLPDSEIIQETNVLAALAAGAVAAGEMFRTSFSDALPRGRVGPSPGRLNVLTYDQIPRKGLPDLPRSVDLGDVVLVGAGAIGEAFAYTLARVGVTGKLVVVDPEVITLSNLQRYVLTTDSDVGASKCRLIARALGASALSRINREAAWGSQEGSESESATFCVAVDNEATRIAIQSSLPRRIYNAWTQPVDIGWSRHESFGDAPCLACLYWPTEPRPSQHQLIARAVCEHELRVLAYLTSKVPVHLPLAAEHIPRLPSLPAPPDSGEWTETSILEAIRRRIGATEEDVAVWRDKQLGDLYREGVCGGALITSNLGPVPEEMTVPLAHQSALAGVMLAIQLIVASSKELLPFRPPQIEARLDVLSGLHQFPARPRQRTARCICSDLDFVDRYREKWFNTGDAPLSEV